MGGIGLIALCCTLGVVLYLNRRSLGFVTGCSWIGSDQIETRGPRKWVCEVHGTILETPDGSIPTINCDELRQDQRRQ